MPFTIALSGLNAASAGLRVTANNIANVNTNGFKMSRAQFAEVFAVGTQSVSSSASGSGVKLSSIAQQFTQGNIDFTDNALDLAIGGEGFFALSDGGARPMTKTNEPRASIAWWRLIVPPAVTVTIFHKQRLR